MDTDIENNQDEKIKHHKEAIKVDAKGLFYSIKAFLINLLDYRSDTDYVATVSAIKNDVSIKGATAWILICSILVCSVGLNANSPAVVIGAMLISPLMFRILLRSNPQFVHGPRSTIHSKNSTTQDFYCVQAAFCHCFF